MNFFEQELRKILSEGDILENPVFVGRACFGDVGQDLRARIEFVTIRIADNYSALQVTMMNRTDGQVDRLKIDLKDLLGIKQVPGNPNFRNGVSPYIWDYGGKIDWYAFTPTSADYQKMREGIGSYIDVFRPREERKPALDSKIKGASERAAKEKTSSDKPWSWDDRVVDEYDL